MTRRRFLAAAGTVVVGACATPAFPQPSSPPASAPSATTRSTPAALNVAPDWDGLAGRLRGVLIRPPDVGYDAARILYNTRFDAIRPQAIVRSAGAEDVAACVRFAHQSGMPIAARAGGHSYGGWSTGSGVVVDVSGLRNVDVGAGTVTIGAGARLADVYAALGARGQGIAAGSCPTVGIAGLALGGGQGVLTRAWGLTCDSLVRAEIVTADGNARTCDAQREPDLFWALRGGGGGNFGVVTSLVLTTRSAAPLAIGFATWPWSRAQAVIHAWQDWIAGMPDEVWSNVHLDGAVGSDPTLLVHCVAMESAGSLAAQLDRLASAVGAAPDSRSVFVRPYAEAMLVEAGCAQRTVSQCHLAGTTPDGQLERETYAARSSIAMAPLSAGAIDALVAGLDALQAIRNAGSGSVLIDAMGGAVARIAPDATAFPHRAATATLQFIAGWNASAPAAAADASTAWLRSLYDRVRPLIGPAAYVNYADPELSDWPQAYYGANYPRLQRIRAEYDPDGLFAFPQAIR